MNIYDFEQAVSVDGTTYSFWRVDSVSFGVRDNKGAIRCTGFATQEDCASNSNGVSLVLRVPNISRFASYASVQADVITFIKADARFIEAVFV